MIELNRYYIFHILTCYFDWDSENEDNWDSDNYCYSYNFIVTMMKCHIAFHNNDTNRFWHHQFHIYGRWSTSLTNKTWHMILKYQIQLNQSQVPTVIKAGKNEVVNSSKKLYIFFMIQGGYNMPFHWIICGNHFFKKTFYL